MRRPAILCVDDERTVLAALREQLRLAFGDAYAIEVAESGEEALEILGELDAEGVSVPVVISDQIMPGLPGDRLLAAVQARWPAAIKIMLTGQASADAVGNAINQARLFRYIAKPWEGGDLVLTVRTGLEAWSRGRQLEEQQRTLRELNQLALDLNRALPALDRYTRLLARLSEALAVTRIALFGADAGRFRRLAAMGERPDDTPRVLRAAPGSDLA